MYKIISTVVEAEDGVAAVATAPAIIPVAAGEAEADFIPLAFTPDVGDAITACRATVAVE
jgi:hypothetical protein